MRVRTLKVFFGLLLAIGLLALAIWQIPTIIARVFLVGLWIATGTLIIALLWMLALSIELIFTKDKETD